MIFNYCRVNETKHCTSFLVGDVIVLGKSDVFKFNFPTEAAKLREKRRSALYTTVSFSPYIRWLIVLSGCCTYAKK